MFCNRKHYNKAVQGARWDWFFFFFFFLICKMIIIFLCVFVLTAWCAFTNVLLPYVLYVVTECNRKIDIWNLDSRINSRMEPEVYNNMMKCITNALSPKRVSDPAYGKDWLIDICHHLLHPIVYLAHKILRMFLQFYFHRICDTLWMRYQNIILHILWFPFLRWLVQQYLC